MSLDFENSSVNGFLIFGPAILFILAMWLAEWDWNRSFPQSGGAKRKFGAFGLIIILLGTLLLGSTINLW